MLKDKSENVNILPCPTHTTGAIQTFWWTICQCLALFLIPGKVNQTSHKTFKKNVNLCNIFTTFTMYVCKWENNKGKDIWLFPLFTRYKKHYL